MYDLPSLIQKRKLLYEKLNNTDSNCQCEEYKNRPIRLSINLTLAEIDRLIDDANRTEKLPKER